MLNKEFTVDHSVQGVRQMKRGLEAQVTLGPGTVPSASIIMTITLLPTDPEWRALQQQLHDLFVRRATSHIREVVKYNDERDLRTAKADRNVERKSA